MRQSVIWFDIAKLESANQKTKDKKSHYVFSAPKLNNLYLCNIIQHSSKMGNQKDTFVMLFCSDDDCYKYLASLKWQEDKFVCKKCGNTTYHKGRSPYSRRCNKCKYDESVTAGTMFEKLKFPILIAFNIIYSMVTTSKGNKSVEFAKKFHIQQRTCWTFMKKVREAMGRMQPNQLKGDVGVGLFNLIDEKMV